MQSGSLTAHAIRLHPGDDLLPSLQKAAQQALRHHKQSRTNSNTQTTTDACCILTAVGSLSKVTLRMANASSNNNKTSPPLKTWNKPLEIVSLVGTLNAAGDKHLHISLSDEMGNVCGGHLVSGAVHTTLELVLGTMDGVSFDRQLDSATGYRELSVEETK